MVLAKMFPALVGAVLLSAGAASMAADYRADEFLGLDLSRAVLSPKPLGPMNEFAPVPVEAKGDIAKSDIANRDVAKSDITKSDTAKSELVNGHRRAVAARAEPKPLSTASTAVAHAGVESRRGAARTRLAHRRGNPLDAQALDARIQTWPCRSGGICDWKQ
jgi:hypothetical protein